MVSVDLGEEGKSQSQFQLNYTSDRTTSNRQYHMVSLHQSASPHQQL